jgi:hypothetical protein
MSKQAAGRPGSAAVLRNRAEFHCDSRGSALLAGGSCVSRLLAFFLEKRRDLSDGSHCTHGSANSPASPLYALDPDRGDVFSGCLPVIGGLLGLALVLHQRGPLKRWWALGVLVRATPRGTIFPPSAPGDPLRRVNCCSRPASYPHGTAGI